MSSLPITKIKIHKVQYLDMLAYHHNRDQRTEELPYKNNYRTFKLLGGQTYHHYQDQCK
jgi:hypothetical protein